MPLKNRKPIRTPLITMFSLPVCLAIPLLFILLVTSCIVACSSSSRDLHHPIESEPPPVLGPYAPHPDPQQLSWSCIGFQGYDVPDPGLQKMEDAFAALRADLPDGESAPVQTLLVENQAQADEVGFTCDLDWSSQKLLVLRIDAASPSSMAQEYGKTYMDIQVEAGEAVVHFRHVETCPPGRPHESPDSENMVAFYQLWPVSGDAATSRFEQHPTRKLDSSVLCTQP